MGFASLFAHCLTLVISCLSFNGSGDVYIAFGQSVGMTYVERLLRCMYLPIFIVNFYAGAHLA